jgi:hypothetical protein
LLKISEAKQFSMYYNKIQNFHRDSARLAGNLENQGANYGTVVLAISEYRPSVL